MRTEGKKVAEASHLSFSEDQRRDASATWPLRKIGDIVSEVRYGTSAKTCEDATGVPVLRMGNIQNGELDLANLKYLAADHEEFPKLLLEPGDILFNRTNSAELVGKSAVYRGNPPKCSYASYLIALRLSEGVPEWVAYYLNSPFGKEWVKSVVSQQVGQANVNGSKLKDLEIPFPPVSEQRRIVARIEELFSRLDAGVAALRHAKAQLQRYRQSVLAAAVTGELTREWREQHPDTEPAEELLKRILKRRREQWNGRGKYKEPGDFNHAPVFKIPESWKWTSLDQLMLNITDGDHQAPPQTDVGIPFLVIGNIRLGSISFDGSRFVREDYFQSLDCFRTPSSGDILYSLVGSFGIAVPVKTEEPFCVQRHIGILRPHSASPTAFLTHALNSRFVYDQASEVSTGTAQKTVPLSGLRKIAIPLPPLAEQRQIVAEVEARTTAIDHLEAELDCQITRSNRLRQSTLANAFAGTLE